MEILVVLRHWAATQFPALPHPCPNANPRRVPNICALDRGARGPPPSASAFSSFSGPPKASSSLGGAGFHSSPRKTSPQPTAPSKGLDKSMLIGAFSATAAFWDWRARGRFKRPPEILRIIFFRTGFWAWRLRIPPLRGRSTPHRGELVSNSTGVSLSDCRHPARGNLVRPRSGVTRLVMPTSELAAGPAPAGPRRGVESGPMKHFVFF